MWERGYLRGWKVRWAWRAPWGRAFGDGELTTGSWVPGLSFTEGWIWIKKDTGVFKPNIKVSKKRKRPSPNKQKGKVILQGKQHGGPLIL